MVIDDDAIKRRVSGFLADLGFEEILARNGYEPDTWH